MPASKLKSKAQMRLFEAAKHNPGFAKKVGISKKVATEMTAGDQAKAKSGRSMAYESLPEKAKVKVKAHHRTRKVPVAAHERAAPQPPPPEPAITTTGYQNLGSARL